MGDISIREAGRRGGRANSKENLSKAGKKGHEARIAKYGPEYYKNLSKMGIEARNKKKEEETKKKNSTLKKIFGI